MINVYNTSSVHHRIVSFYNNNIETRMKIFINFAPDHLSSCQTVAKNRNVTTHINCSIWKHEEEHTISENNVLVKNVQTIKKKVKWFCAKHLTEKKNEEKKPAMKQNNQIVQDGMVFCIKTNLTKFFNLNYLFSLVTKRGKKNPKL